MQCTGGRHRDAFYCKSCNLGFLGVFVRLGLGHNRMTACFQRSQSLWKRPWNLIANEWRSKVECLPFGVRALFFCGGANTTDDTLNFGHHWCPSSMSFLKVLKWALAFSASSLATTKNGLDLWISVTTRDAENQWANDIQTNILLLTSARTRNNFLEKLIPFLSILATLSWISEDFPFTIASEMYFDASRMRCKNWFLSLIAYSAGACDSFPLHRFPRSKEPCLPLFLQRYVSLRSHVISNLTACIDLSDETPSLLNNSDNISFLLINGEGIEIFHRKLFWRLLFFCGWQGIGGNRFVARRVVCKSVIRHRLVFGKRFVGQYCFGGDCACSSFLNIIQYLLQLWKWRWKVFCHFDALVVEGSEWCWRRKRNNEANTEVNNSDIRLTFAQSFDVELHRCSVTRVSRVTPSQWFPLSFQNIEKPFLNNIRSNKCGSHWACSPNVWRTGLNCNGIPNLSPSCKRLALFLTQCVRDHCTHPKNERGELLSTKKCRHSFWQRGVVLSWSIWTNNLTMWGLITANQRSMYFKWSFYSLKWMRKTSRSSCSMIFNSSTNWDHLQNIRISFGSTKDSVGTTHSLDYLHWASKKIFSSCW